MTVWTAATRPIICWANRARTRCWAATALTVEDPADQGDGGADDDEITGGAGFDTIVGGTGDDLMAGAFNADIFVFADFGGGFGADTISDFEATNVFERIDLRLVSSIRDLDDLLTNHVQQVGSDVLIDAGGGNTILLQNVDRNDLDQNGLE